MRVFAWVALVGLVEGGAGCGARTGVDVEVDAGAGRRDAGGRVDAGAGRRDAGGRVDAGVAEGCAVSAPFDVLDSGMRLSYPALARRGDGAMLIATAGTPTEGEVDAVAISPIGESIGGMSLLFHRGWGGSITSFRRAPEDGAYWVVIRGGPGADLVAGLLSERAVAS